MFGTDRQWISPDGNRGVGKQKAESFVDHAYSRTQAAVYTYR